MDDPGASFIGLVSSDWSECLSPNGPFDPISYTFPELKDDLDEIFIDYTGNRITLTDAASRIKKLLPEPITPQQMDAYLNESFDIYKGVNDLIQWLREMRIMFMINSTGTMGYFQRCLSKGLIEPPDHISCNPLIHYTNEEYYDKFPCRVLEIEDKAACSEKMALENGISLDRVIVVGDSGGDGPHFKWAAAAGAALVGSMTKASLNQYCATNGIEIDYLIGPSYAQGKPRDIDMEKGTDFTQLKDFLSYRLNL